MAEPACFGSLQTVAVRVATLTVAGGPNTGALHGYVTDAVIDTKIDVEIEEGDEFVLKNAQGAICQTYKDCDRFKRVTIEMNLCQLDAELIQLLCGGSVMRDLAGTGLGNAIGYEVPHVTDACQNGVCLELWTKAWDTSVQATPPYAGGNVAAYFHFVFPRAKFSLGSLNLENDFMTIPVKGFGDENPQITSNGPFDDWPADVSARGGVTGAMGFFLDTTKPTPACGAITVSSAAS